MLFSVNLYILVELKIVFVCMYVVYQMYLVESGAGAIDSWRVFLGRNKFSVEV